MAVKVATVLSPLRIGFVVISEMMVASNVHFMPVMDLFLILDGFLDLRALVLPDMRGCVALGIGFTHVASDIHGLLHGIVEMALLFFKFFA
jgi:hypothetical protein